MQTKNMKLKRLLIIYLFIVAFIIFIEGIIISKLPNMQLVQTVDNSTDLNINDEQSIINYYSKSIRDMGEDSYNLYQVKNLGEEFFIASILIDQNEKKNNDYDYYPIKIKLNNYEIVDSYDGKVDETSLDLSNVNNYMIVNIEVTNMYDGDRIYTLPFNNVIHYVNGEELDYYSVIAYVFSDDKSYYHRKAIKEIYSNESEINSYGEIILKAKETINLKVVLCHRGNEYDFDNGTWVMESRIYGKYSNSNFKIYLKK